MLEKAIEIEGLLRIIRDGNPLPETYALLKAKAADLLDQILALKPQETPSDLPISKVDFVMTAPVSEPETPEVVFTEEVHAEVETATTQTEAVPEPADTTTTDLPEDITFEEDDDILLTLDDSTDELTYEAEHSAETTEELKDATEPKPVVMTEERQNPTPEQKRPARLKSAFSLNDRFLYARELFNGNMKTFDTAIETIETIDDYSMVEHYFYDEMDWNPEDNHVAAFMEIIRPHFR